MPDRAERCQPDRRRAADGARVDAVNPGPVLANAVWLASGIADARRFRAALAEPAQAQARWLRAHLARHARSEFGIRHDFAGMDDIAAFVQRVPVVEYTDLAADMQRIADGEPDVLACGPVTHLAPTSGSTGGRKLIPFNSALAAAFSAAVSPWMFDLVRQRPRLIGGPAYWSISPLSEPEQTPDRKQPSTVPTDFADDADYLGGPRAWLVRHALAVPSSVRFASDAESFWRITLLALLRQRDLRLISVWHPSFLELLTGAAEQAWPELLDAVKSGSNPWRKALPESARQDFEGQPDSQRAAELTRVGPGDSPAWWPALQVVSCWGEQAAEPGWRKLVRRLPHVLVQPKGLLATECVVTIPFGGEQPLAITSHFFEFIDESGELRFAHQLERGRNYEVVVTNGGGLWRYRLGDVVECTGAVAATPSLRFVGRARVSDLRGEKLSEAFVADVLRDLWAADERPSFATLRARDRNGAAGYELVVPEDLDSSGSAIVQRLETALCANPHYALARRLGQLAEVAVVTVPASAPLMELQASPGRIGDVKPRVLAP
ncbi:MAG TPA: GH3 auxin-responsive promoter family protein [Gemmatimonadaceae bacterium]